MNSKARIASILNANNLDYSITGLLSFNLSILHLNKELNFELPTNIRLGHLAEKILSELIKSSTNYKVLHENVQIIESKKTIGEIDFIIEDIDDKKLIHLELAYKFYLFDPSISTLAINNWIGPNRNDSLKDKLEKLKKKQFPLLQNESTKSTFNSIDMNTVSQALCLLVSLYIPYEFKDNLTLSYERAIKGYYLSLDKFVNLDNSEKSYHLPAKKEWGIDPSENEIWTNLSGIENYIRTSIEEKQAPLCWQKHKGTYQEFFIVWW